MLSVLLANGMGMIWHGHEATWTEPVASAIALIFGFIPTAAAVVIFYACGGFIY